jgi:hypothetical protein
MKAVLSPDYGGIDVLRYEGVEVPAVGEVVIGFLPMTGPGRAASC